MKLQIRRAAFETNSSSTHALNVFKGNDYTIPENILISPGEFEWECKTYNYPEDKLSYLYTYLLSFYDKETAQEFLTVRLEKLGVKEVIFEDCDGWDVNGYIDHSNELHDMDILLNEFFEDFVFNSASYIETGNDNDDLDVNEDPYADFSIYKGN